MTGTQYTQTLLCKEGLYIDTVTIGLQMILQLVVLNNRFTKGLATSCPNRINCSNSIQNLMKISL